MKLMIDGDSCPRRLRRIVERAAYRTGVSLIIAADRPIPLQEQRQSPHGVEQILAASGSGGADELLVERAGPGDIVVTRDFPLAERLVERGAVVLDDRGGVYTGENIAARRSERDRMMELREMGIVPEEERRGGPGEREIKAFADALDRLLSAREGPG
jgi:hypothetical protein